MIGTSAMLVAPSAFAAPAADGTVTASYTKDGTGLKGVLPDADGKRWPAGSFVFNVEGGAVETYCIQFTNSDVEKTGAYTAQSWAQAGVKNLDKAADVAARHDSIGTPMTDPQWEKAATQVAIWHFTDAVAWDKTGNAKFTARVDQLIKGATAATEPASSFKLTATANVTGTGEDAKDVIVAALTTATGAPLAGQDLTVVVDGEETNVKTDAAGSATVTVDAGDAERTAKVVFDGTAEAGTVLAPATGKQKVLTATYAPITREAAVQLAAASAAPATKTPAATVSKTAVAAKPAVKASKTTTPAAAPASLPYTGSGAAPWMVLAGLGTAAGGFILRRRSVNRTH
jgi:LPXTG-motif cell wall-anchored protein